MGAISHCSQPSGALGSSPSPTWLGRIISRCCTEIKQFGHGTIAVHNDILTIMISDLQLDLIYDIYPLPIPPLTLLAWAYYTQVLHCAKTARPRNRSRPQRQRNGDDVEATTRELEKSRQKGLIWQGKYNFRSVLIHFPYLLHIVFLNYIFFSIYKAHLI